MTIEKKKKRNHIVKWARPERVVKEVTVRELELGMTGIIGQNKLIFLISCINPGGS